MNTKFFMITYPYEKCTYDIYACHQNTSIPTIEEVIKRENLSRFCANGAIKEISMRKFLRLHQKLLKSLANNANDLIEWSPNSGQLHTWKWWDSVEE